MCVTVYSTVRDEYAGRLVKWLTLKNVETQHKFIDLNPQWAAEYQQVGGRGGYPVSLVEYEGKSALVNGVDRRDIVRVMHSIV